MSEVFQQGEYQPLEARGKYGEHIIAFARSYDRTTAIAIAPRFFTSLIQVGEYPLGEIWQDTYIQLPSETSSKWEDTITSQTIQTDGQLQIAATLKEFPVALLINN